jgi:DNA-binding transcriptional MerR regulator
MTAPTNDNEPRLRISDAAARLGLSPRTLRYYEELGLVTPSGYTKGGARRYGSDDLGRVERICQLKGVLGLNLDDIKGVIETEARLDELRQAYWANKAQPSVRVRNQQRAIVEEALELNEALARQLDEKMSHIDTFRAKLSGDAKRCREVLAELDPSTPNSER